MTAFNIVSAPAAAAIATASQAAGGAGRRNICTGIIGSTVATTVPVARLFRLRDGATGAGTVLLELSVPAGAIFSLNGIFIVGSANTAMTAEFTANGDVTEIQRADLVGIVI